jgi:hypothetical protein
MLSQRPGELESCELNGGGWIDLTSEDAESREASAMYSQSV